MRKQQLLILFICIYVYKSSELCENNISTQSFKEEINHFKTCINFELQEIKKINRQDNEKIKIEINNIKTQNIGNIIDKNNNNIDNIIQNIDSIMKNFYIYKFLTLIIHIFLVLYSKKKSYILLILSLLLFFFNFDIKFECVLTIVLIKRFKY